MHTFPFDAQIVHVNIILYLSVFWSEWFECYKPPISAETLQYNNYMTQITYNYYKNKMFFDKKKQQNSLVSTICVRMFYHVYDLYS